MARRLHSSGSPNDRDPGRDRAAYYCSVCELSLLWHHGPDYHQGVVAPWSALAVKALIEHPGPDSTGPIIVVFFVIRGGIAAAGWDCLTALRIASAETIIVDPARNCKYCRPILPEETSPLAFRSLEAKYRFRTPPLCCPLSRSLNSISSVLPLSWKFLWILSLVLSSFFSSRVLLIWPPTHLILACLTP